MESKTRIKSQFKPVVFSSPLHESIKSSGEGTMKRLKSDWDIIDKAVEEMLNDHMRVWGWYDYFIISDDTILVKVYNDDDEVMFTVKAKLVNGKLEVIDVW